ARALQLHRVTGERGAKVESRRRHNVTPLRGAAVAAEAARGRAEAAPAEHAAEQVVKVGTGEIGALAAAARPDHAAEDILEPVGASPRREAGGPGPQRAQLVVLCPLLRVRQHRVRFADFLELRLGRRVARVGVGVVFAGELAVRLLQVGVRDILRDTKNLEEVLLEPVLARHAYSFAAETTTCAGRSSRSPMR